MNSKVFKWENIVAIILLLLILTKVQLINFIDTGFIFQTLIIIGFFLFSILGIIGIVLQKHWGYISIYILILIATVGLGIAPIPFIINLLPVKAANYLVILTSVILFSFTLYLQLKLLKSANKNIS